MDTNLAYNQALDYLYSFVDYSLKKSSELARADFNLDRMRELMTCLGNPEQRYPIFHVAGTKGKGSTSALIASALTAAGYKTGLYTSPHLLDYVERIQLDGQPVSRAELVDLVQEVKSFVSRIPRLTTFEITTAIGLNYFAHREADAAVIEVGLGGRLDATNIVTPRVSIITSLSYDHMAVLGNTLAQIAGEKAGIIKPGVPVVSAPQVDEARLVLEQVAAQRNSPFTLVGRDLAFMAGGYSLEGQSLSVTIPRNSSCGEKSVILRIPLLGDHQVTNAATAYAGLIASGLAICDEDIRAGFERVHWPCRFEIVRQEPPVVLDSAHNQDSFEKLARTLEKYFPGRAVLLIFGSSEDKDMLGMLKTLKGKARLVLATRSEHPRATDPEKIAETAGSLGIPCEVQATVASALARALSLADQGGELILSAGSVFVTAGVKAAWQEAYVGE